jgi:hypothetical protein
VPKKQQSDRWINVVIIVVVVIVVKNKNIIKKKEEILCIFKYKEGKEKNSKLNHQAKLL